MTPEQAVDELRYRNYAYNRDRNPRISPAQWEAVYGPTDAMERRYQAEQARRGNRVEPTNTEGI